MGRRTREAVGVVAAACAAVAFIVTAYAMVAIPGAATWTPIGIIAMVVFGAVSVTVFDGG